MNISELFFFQNALIGAILAAVVCGIVGAYVVVRRLVFISGGITHASLGGVGIALYCGWSPLWTAMAFSVLSALGIRSMTGRMEEREDSVIAVFWTLGMAVGILFAFMTPGYGADLTTYLFGNVLTVTRSDLWLLGGIGLMLCVGCFFFLPQITAVAFDPDFARTRGIPVVWMDYILIALIAVSVVAVLRIVGIVLALALLTIPQMTANLFVSRMRPLLCLSVFFALLAGLSGLFFSFCFDVPSGASIIVSACLFYGLARAAFWVRRLF